eukprot:1777184-Amphidinium_carterae.1
MLSVTIGCGALCKVKDDAALNDTGTVREDQDLYKNRPRTDEAAVAQSSVFPEDLVTIGDLQANIDSELGAQRGSEGGSGRDDG